jgi:hypothetical protein
MLETIDSFKKSMKSSINGAEGIRTPYLRDANAAFSRVNYGPVTMIIIAYPA